MLNESHILINAAGQACNALVLKGKNAQKVFDANPTEENRQAFRAALDAADGGLAVYAAIIDANNKLADLKTPKSVE